MPELPLFGEAEGAQQLDEFLRIELPLSLEKFGEFGMVLERAKERPVIPELQKFFEGKLLQPCHPDEILVPPRFFFSLSAEARMGGKDDDFSDRISILVFELEGASASHRIADEMARLRDVLFLEVQGDAGELAV